MKQFFILFKTLRIFLSMLKLTNKEEHIAVSSDFGIDNGNLFFRGKEVLLIKELSNVINIHVHVTFKMLHIAVSSDFGIENGNLFFREREVLLIIENVVNIHVTFKNVQDC